MDMLLTLFLGMALPSLLCAALILPVGYTKVYFGDNGVFAFLCLTVLITSFLIGKSFNRTGRVVSKSKSGLIRQSRRMTDREIWCEAQGVLYLGDSGVVYVDELPENGRARRISQYDMWNVDESPYPPYQVNYQDYSCVGGRLVRLYDSDSSLQDGS